jgi:hypothetical protein
VQAADNDNGNGDALNCARGIAVGLLLSPLLWFFVFAVVYYFLS